MTRHENLFGFVALAALWGASYPAIRAAKAGVDPLLMAALRFDAIGIVVLAYALVRGQRIVPGSADARSILVGGIGIVAVHNGLLFVGQARVSGAVGAVVLATVPIWSVGFAAAFLDTARPTPSRVAGVCLGLIGTAILAVPGPMAVDAPDPLGVGLLLASAAAFALAAVGLRRESPALGVAARQGWMMLVGGPLLHVASVLAGEPQTITVTPRIAIAFGYLVLAAGVAGYLLYFGLLDRLGPVEINLVGYVAPVFATVVGWYWLDEVVSAGTVVGFLVICVGFALVKRPALRGALRGASR
ncbi:DMT family transporter [Haloarchaeobius sp. DYHT-AS-18]|uniref:DMT family transporter n=1 Tax=Haloarchaeobius sp. DYHT-AS-18 TaxID=3446117 RepID=UPI003EB90523